jgi:lambda family phage portal protein
MRAPAGIVQRIRDALGVSRQRARALTRSMGFDGAAGGRRLRNQGTLDLPLASQVAARQTLARRARYLEANNGYAAAGVNAWASALVGCGIKPQSAHPDAATRKAINEAFDRWTREADLDGLADFFGLQDLAARRMVVDGEIFVAFVHDGSGRLRLRLLDGEQVAGAYHTELAAGSRIVAGVEFDTAGRRIAYHAWKQRPGLPIMPSLELMRLPAEDVLHVFKVTTPGQVRGVSWLASILMRLADLDALNDAQIVRQKVAALLAGFVTDPTGGAGGFDGAEDGRGNLDGGLEPGTLKVLPPGADIKFSDPAKIGQEAVEFIKVTAKEVAAGLGVPFEELTGDRSEGNYSSMRDGKLDFRRRAEAIQHSVIVNRFCDPVWRRWIATEILSGRLDAPGFERDPEPWFAVNWLPPKNDWVDPLKDAQAEILAINAGLMSRRQAVAARGYDLEKLDAEIAQDRADAAALGLDFNRPPPAPAAAPAQGAEA